MGPQDGDTRPVGAGGDKAGLSKEERPELNLKARRGLCQGLAGSWPWLSGPPGEVTNAGLREVLSTYHAGEQVSLSCIEEIYSVETMKHTVLSRSLGL